MQPIWIKTNYTKEQILGRGIRLIFPSTAPNIISEIPASEVIFGILEIDFRDDGLAAISVTLSAAPSDCCSGLRLTEGDVARMHLDVFHIGDYELRFEHPAKIILALPPTEAQSDTYYLSQSLHK